MKLNDLETENIQDAVGIIFALKDRLEEPQKSTTTAFACKRMRFLCERIKGDLEELLQKDNNPLI